MSRQPLVDGVILERGLEAVEASNGQTHGASDVDPIRQALELLVAPGSVAECRVPKTSKGVVSGYFDSIDRLADTAFGLHGWGEGVYITVNPVNPGLLARASNHVVEYAKATTGDADIVSRQWFFIDFDPKRPSGISSTDEEHALALTRARECRDWLRAEGFKGLILADSGNGAHLLARVDLPNDHASRSLIHECLRAVAQKYDDDHVIVDLGTANAARLIKIYGTMAMKGDATLERPHRWSRILEYGDVDEITPRDCLERLRATIALEVHEDRGTPGARVRTVFSLETWIEQHPDLIRVKRTGDWAGFGKKWILNPCPFNAEHTNDSAVLIRFQNYAIAFKCHHTSCADKTWRDLRALAGDGAVAEGDELEDTTAPQAFAFQPVGDLLKKLYPPQEWLVDRFLPLEGISTIVGRPKAGKTVFSRNLAAAVAQCIPFLDRPTTQGITLARPLRASPSGRIDRAPSGGREGPPEVDRGGHRVFRLTKVRDATAYAEVLGALEGLLAIGP